VAAVRILHRVQGGGGVIEYPIGASGQVVVLTDAALAHMAACRQLRRSHAEAGGQLFARLDGHRVVVEEATGPRGTDRRTRASYLPDRAAEQKEIVERHACGLHYVGEWHTHPDSVPEPSHRDRDSMAECVARSEHALNGFLLVIVGQADAPAGLHVAVHDEQGCHRLAPNGIEGR
jgi:integrative and conjugative element protein (TIGR02256 family)